MTLTVVISDAQINAFKAAIKNTGKSLRKELAVACNLTAKRCKNIVAKNISKELALPQKAIKLSITIGRSASELNINTDVDVKKDGRVNLGYFGARQTKQGVSYRVSKTSGRSFAAGAFRIARYNGKVYKRKGKERFPLKGLYGPSPWGVHVVGKTVFISAKETEKELLNQVNRRLRFLQLKQAGTI